MAAKFPIYHDVPYKITWTKIYDKFSREELDLYEGWYNGKPAMFRERKEYSSGQQPEDSDENAYGFKRLIDLNCTNIIKGYDIVPVMRRKHKKRWFFVAEPVSGTLMSYLNSKQENLFERREDGSYDMSTLLKRITMGLFHALETLEKISFHVAGLTLQETYVSEVGDAIVVKLFRGIKEGDGLPMKKQAKSTFVKIVADIFEAFNKNASVDLTHLFLRTPTESWSCIRRHPAYLEVWEKIHMIYEAIHRLQNSQLDSCGLAWPTDNRLVQFADNYDMTASSTLIRFLRDKLQHFFERGGNRNFKETFKDEVQFVRYLEHKVPTLWIELFELL